LRNVGAHRLLVDRRELLFAAVSALTVSSAGKAFGKSEWLITADEIEAAKRLREAPSSTQADDKAEIERQALDAPNAGDREAAGRQSHGAPGTDKNAKSSAPAILFLKPAQSGKVPAPVDFEVRFIPVAPARIEPSSVKVIYSGLFDITDRIREFGGKIDAHGIALSKAPLKPDVYRVAVVVADSAGNSARQTVQFTVL